MGRKFDVEYDDFSGGYFVGTNEVAQPMDTWVGNDVAVSAKTGRLLPLPGKVQGNVVKSVSAAYNMTQASNGYFHYLNATTGAVPWYEDFAQSVFGSVAAIGFVRSNSIQFNGYILTSNSGAGSSLTGTAIDGSGQLGGVTTTISATGLKLIGSFKYWVVGSIGTNRMWYSAPNDHTSWNVANYYDIGSASNVITGYVDMLDSLYVLTTGGTYVVSGVFGATTTIRQLNRIPCADGGPFDTTVLAMTSNVTAGQYDGPLMLAGSTGRRILQGVADVTRIVQVGTAVIVASSDSSVFVNDPTTSRAWHRRSNVGSSGIVPSTVNRTQYFYVNQGVPNARLNQYRLNPETAEVDSATSAFLSRSVTLADYQSKSPFRVTRAQAEIVIGDASTATRSIGVQMGSLSVPVNYATGPTTFSAATSTAQTYSFTANSPGSLLAVDFNANDAGPTMNVAPIVTLQGVELRRLILHCEEV